MDGSLTDGRNFKEGRTVRLSRHDEEFLVMYMRRQFRLGALYPNHVRFLARIFFRPNFKPKLTIPLNYKLTPYTNHFSYAKRLSLQPILLRLQTFKYK